MMTIHPGLEEPLPFHTNVRVLQRPICRTRQAPDQYAQTGLVLCVGQACLAAIAILIKPVTVTDRNTVPSTDKLFKSFLGSASMNHETGDPGIGHNPQPMERADFFPGGFVKIIDIPASGYVPYGFIMRPDRCRGPVNNFLYSAGTDGNTGDGRTGRRTQ